jgi:hypothetical protein
LDLLARRSVVATGAVLILAFACGHAPLPARLAGLPRTRVWTGARAARIVAEIHGRNVTTASTTVADYGRRSELRVWLSRYRGPAEANAALEAMLRRLRSGSTPFAPPQEHVRTPGRFVTVGPGGHHATWVSGGSLYWVGGDPDRVSLALERLPLPDPGLLI